MGGSLVNSVNGQDSPSSPVRRVYVIDQFKARHIMIVMVMG